MSSPAPAPAPWPRSLRRTRRAAGGGCGGIPSGMDFLGPMCYGPAGRRLRRGRAGIEADHAGGVSVQRAPCAGLDRATIHRPRRDRTPVSQRPSHRPLTDRRPSAPGRRCRAASGRRRRGRTYVRRCCRPWRVACPGAVRPRRAAAAGTTGPGAPPGCGAGRRADAARRATAGAAAQRGAAPAAAGGQGRIGPAETPRRRRGCRHVAPAPGRSRGRARSPGSGIGDGLASASGGRAVRPRRRCRRGWAAGDRGRAAAVGAHPPVGRRRWSPELRTGSNAGGARHLAADRTPRPAVPAPGPRRPPPLPCKPPARHAASSHRPMRQSALDAQPGRRRLDARPASWPAT